MRGTGTTTVTGVYEDPLPSRPNVPKNDSGRLVCYGGSSDSDGSVDNDDIVHGNGSIGSANNVGGIGNVCSAAHGPRADRRSLPATDFLKKLSLRS